MERLAQSERLAALGTMSAVLAHEIKNPLAALKGNAQLLLEGLEEGTRQRAQADRVVRASARLQGLVDNLLDFVRSGALERVDLDPAEVLRAAAEDASPRAQLDLDAAPASWSLDGVRLRQVLENLLRNAEQASPGEVAAAARVDQDRLIFTVSDRGPGIPEGDMELIFRAVSHHQDPRRRPRAHRRAARGRAPRGYDHRAQPPGRRRGDRGRDPARGVERRSMARILVVDDDDDVRGFLAEALEASGHEVEQAADGEQANLRLLARGFHLLVTDLKMPRLDGMELLRRMRIEQPELEIIVLTAHGKVAGAVEAIKLGAFDYLEKPLESPAALRAIVDRAVERRSLRDHAERSREEPSPRLSWGAPSMAAVEAALRKVAATSATVLLLGESGTGKEVAAREIHRQSARAAGPFVAVNCAALSEHLVESELFGHERGAFTGAVARQRGKLELCEGGTFFLDEVGELKLELQAKLLRVLQERRFERVGGSATIDADVRWIAATNRDLLHEQRAGRFREDLFHRLAVFPIRMPPLRERREDIPALADALLARIARSLGRAGLDLDEGARRAITAADWPGNVRELGNALERAAILADGPRITEGDLVLMTSAMTTSPRGRDAPTMDEAESDAIERALQKFDGNRRQAADYLGIGLRTLYEKLKKRGSR